MSQRRLPVSAVLRARGGNATAEFALVVPVFLTLVLGIMEFGRILWIRNALQNAVEMAARCATVNTTSCNTPANVQTFAASQTAGMLTPNGTFTASTAACGNVVSATYAYTYLTGVLPLPALTLTAQACFPK